MSVSTATMPPRHAATAAVMPRSPAQLAVRRFCTARRPLPALW